MKATTRISEPHRAHTSGPTSKTCRTSRAQQARDVRAGPEVGVGSGGFAALLPPLRATARRPRLRADQPSGSGRCAWAVASNLGVHQVRFERCWR